MEYMMAKSMGAKLLTLFPQMTPEEAEGWVKVFTHYSDQDVSAGIDRYFAKHDSNFKSPNNAKLKGAIDAVANQSALSRAIAKRERERAQTESIQEYWEAIATEVGTMSDKEIAHYLPDAIASLDANVREFYAARDPRKSKPVMEAILAARRRELEAMEVM